MNSEDRTTILPATGRPEGADGRSARRAAERRRGHGRRRRRGAMGPMMAVAAAVAGTSVIAALTGAGYAVFRGEEGSDNGSQAVAYEPLVAAEAGDVNGIQVPGAGGAPVQDPDPTDQARAATATPPPSTAPATPSASATTPGHAASTAPTTASGTPRNPTAGPGAGNTPGGTAGAPDPGKPTGAPTTAPTAAPSTAKPSPTAPRPTATTAPGGSSNSSFAQQVADLVNTQRSQAGCGPLTVDPKLTTAAQVHSDDMADRNFFDHASPEGRHADYRIEAAGYRWSSWGENIARGQKDPAAVMESWMNSPGHRANILNCSFKQIGVGVRTGSGGPWWTQVFASPS
ncbi:CAP domain-containing protein [Kitasatospora purpeofusca]|uniref:CAP domain-containing protein n=1 Tax=Kitasatospora purpeofusca TaxID=67352 RepID=UPI002256A830|nr:CAP domain-containing protein [Kitasatospora purpeofusca]MCX4759303.1 CAP domain-containing protein [Kitasatospora purpeofusca]WSR30303.1 CAP domain-containing protein [Kitasatospora purpeofusca]WSR38536.1 CAP domain-containing protein [Kitasatospora purpeofusca]